MDVRAAALTLALCGCNDNLPVQSFIDKVRVLAVQASPAEVAPGEVTRLSPLVVEPEQRGDRAPLSALWLACRVDPGATSTMPCGFGVLDGSSLPPACAAETGGDACVLDEELFTTAAPSAAVLGSDGTGQLLVTLVVADTDAGASDCYLSTLKNAGLPTEPDRCVITYKRVAVAASPSNHNPTLDALALATDGGVLSVLDDGVVVTASPDANHRTKHDLIADRSAAAAEQKSDGTYEALSLSWFTSAGKLDGGRSSFDPTCDSQKSCAEKVPPVEESTTWEAPTTDEIATETADGLLHVWAVLRDDRGGVGWRTGVVRVQ